MKTKLYICRMECNSIIMKANTKKTVYVIINPTSGTSAKQALPHKIAKKLDPHKFNVHIFITGYAGHETEIAREAVERGVDYVIAVGGDGTVNKVGRELVHSDTALGIIPLGSGNGLGRDLGIPLNADKALDIIAEEYVETIDYGKANDDIFFCTCGMGFDAEVANKVAGKKQRGTLMYFTNMLEAFFDQKPQTYKIECPEGTIEQKAFVVTCANASQYGYNAHIAPHADIQDGMMNIAILQPLKILDVPKTSMQLFASKIDKNSKMIELTTNKVTITRETEGVMHIDGDAKKLIGKVLNVEIVPKGLKVLLPKNAPKKNPLDPQEILLSILRAIS